MDDNIDTFITRRGSLEVIRWSLMPYDNPDSLQSISVSTLEEDTAGTNFFSITSKSHPIQLSVKL